MKDMRLVSAQDQLKAATRDELNEFSGEAKAALLVNLHEQAKSEDQMFRLLSKLTLVGFGECGFPEGEDD